MNTVSSPLAPGIEFTPIDTNYAKILRIRAALTMVVLLVVAAIPLYFFARNVWWLWLVLPVIVFSCLWALVLAKRRAGAIGYFEGEDDLTVCSGIMFRKVLVIPFGRMQQVNIGAGPIERRFGLATLSFVTASAQASPDIPGLRADEADRLRASLTALGQSRMEGL